VSELIDNTLDESTITCASSSANWWTLKNSAANCHPRPPTRELRAWLRQQRPGDHNGAPLSNRDAAAR
jgi:hypothetical protein